MTRPKLWKFTLFFCILNKTFPKGDQNFVLKETIVSVMKDFVHKSAEIMDYFENWYLINWNETFIGIKPINVLHFENQCSGYGKMYRLLDIVVKTLQNLHNFWCFHVSRVTFRLLEDLEETNFVQKVSVGDVGPL